MRYAWDQEHAYFPRRRGPMARLRQLVLSRLRTWDTASAARVDLFVANSRFVAERIRRYYGRTAEVLAPPVEVEYFTPGDGDEPADPDGGGYALTVSALAPYKRVEVAIEACERAGVPLRVVGTGPEMRRLRRRAGPGVRFLGRVSDPELRRLYRGALCLLQPQVEDFGIAAVEALACGTPVVARGRGGVLDIVEDGRHGLLVAEADGGPGGLAAALAEAIDKTRQIQFNQLNLRQRAERFSAESFDRSFTSLLGSASSRRELLP
jgi:glycosyltransferase involved in cell wall biosynthesis